MSEVDNEPCLWLRGILPVHHTRISKDDIAQRRIFYMQGDVPPIGSWPQEFIMGMGVGGSTAKYPKPEGVGQELHA